MLKDIFDQAVTVSGNLIISGGSLAVSNTQQQTADAFSSKWQEFEKFDHVAVMAQQKQWYLALYGFASEDELARFLQGRKVIFDAGCGAGFKAAWFAELAPASLVIAMDISDSVYPAARKYRDRQNLFFMQGDIAATGMQAGRIDYISCDQVIHHTKEPEKTFAELARVLAPGGMFACYVYRKKAVPSELLDDYFRQKCSGIGHEELMDFSRQLTELGKTLSELKLTIPVPDMPLLDIKGGTYDLQRFIYWNFMKCYWNSELGYESSVLTNYDWYSPSQAKRYSREEFMGMVSENQLETAYFHEEEACYSGRFLKR